MKDNNSKKIIQAHSSLRKPIMIFSFNSFASLFNDKMVSLKFHCTHFSKHRHTSQLLETTSQLRLAKCSILAAPSTHFQKISIPPTFRHPSTHTLQDQTYITHPISFSFHIPACKWCSGSSANTKHAFTKIRSWRSFRFPKQMKNSKAKAHP